MNGPRSSPTHIAARSGARASQAVKRAFITGATAEIGLSVALDVAFVLFVVWGATPSRRAIEPNKSVKSDQTEFSYPSRVVLQPPTRSSGD